MKKKLLRSLVGVLLVAGVVSAYGMLRLRRVPAAALRCLRAPQQMVLYSVVPDRHLLIEPPGPTNFHGFRILGQTAIITLGNQRAVVNTIERSIVRSFGVENGCFNPHHGMRVSDASGTYDFVICFECMQIYIYSGDKQIGDATIFGWPAPLDEILQSAHVPLGTR